MLETAKGKEEEEEENAGEQKAGRCILIRYPYLETRDVYAEICTRRKAYETRGISCFARLLFYAGNGFLASRPSPPRAPRPGDTGHCIRPLRTYEIVVYTEYSTNMATLEEDTGNYGSLPYFSFFFLFRESCIIYVDIYIYMR